MASALRAGNSGDQLFDPPQEPARPTKQELVDELVWRHGGNLLQRADCQELLGKAGLAASDVSVAMVERANKHARQRLVDGFKAGNADPKRQFAAVAVGDPDTDPAAESHPNPRYDASHADLERRQREALNQKDSQADAQSRKSGGATVAEPQWTADNECMGIFYAKTITPEGKERIMVKVSEKSARELFVALGHEQAASEWNAKKLESRLKRLPEFLDNAGKLEGDGLKLLKRISKALEESGPDAVSLDDGEAEEAPAAGKNGKAPKVEKPAKEKKAKTPKVPKEKKEGSNGSANNAKVQSVLGKKPKSFKEICEATGLSRGQVRYSFLDSLVASKVAVKTKEGWALK